MKGRWKDWLRQAEDDMKWAQDTCRSEHWAQACFICQQAGEKALKALAFYLGFDQVRSHSLVEIARSLKINGEIERMAKRLDLYYISARYPDAFPSGTPSDFFTQDQAEEAIVFASAMIERARTDTTDEHG
jgi:HEPN domain-containing protein